MKTINQIVTIFLIILPFLISLFGTIQSRSNIKHICGSFRDCNQNERCILGKCACKFGFGEKIAKNSGNRRKVECGPFACIKNDSCLKMYGKNTYCERYTI